MVFDDFEIIQVLIDALQSREIYPAPICDVILPVHLQE